MKTIWDWLGKAKTLLSIGGIVFAMSMIGLFFLQLNVVHVTLMTCGFLMSVLLFRFAVRQYTRTLMHHPWKMYVLGVLLFVLGTAAGLLFQTPLSVEVLIGVKFLFALVAALGITLIFYMLRGATEFWKNISIVIVSTLGWILYTVLAYRFPYESPWHEFFVSMRIPYFILAAFFILCLFTVRVKQKPYKKLDNTDKNMKA